MFYFLEHLVNLHLIEEKLGVETQMGSTHN